MTATLAPASTSASVKRLPRAMVQTRTSKKSGVVPVTLVVQFWSSENTWVLVRISGAAARTLGTSVRMASRSSQVMVGWLPNPPRAPPELVEPGMTMSRLVPMESNTF